MTARVAPISPTAQGPNVLSRPAAFASQATSVQKLKILHVFNYIGLGGTELTALRLIQHLGNQDFTHKLFGLRGADRAMLAVRYPDADVFTPENDEKRSKFQFLLLRRVIQAYRPQVVHSRNWGAIEAVGAAKSAGVPIVIHSEHGYEKETMNGFPLHRRAFRRLAYGMTDSLLTVTEELREYHARQGWVSAGAFRVISNGIDLQTFSPKSESMCSFRRELNISSERFLLGTIGRMVAVKDQLTLLRAAEMLASEGLNIHVLIVGSGPEEQALRNRAASSPALDGRVSFMAPTERVPETLKSMDAFILPSLSEGMSNTLLEAMACGIPVVATNAGGNSEIIEDRRSGLLFSPGDFVALARLVKEVHGDPDLRIRLAKAGRDRIERRYSLENMVDAYRQLYVGLAQQRGLLDAEVP
jgi:sugar transferase (PEP-CTERM/EpsH1 system associated)